MAISRQSPHQCHLHTSEVRTLCSRRLRSPSRAKKLPNLKPQTRKRTSTARHHQVSISDIPNPYIRHPQQQREGGHLPKDPLVRTRTGSPFPSHPHNVEHTHVLTISGVSRITRRRYSIPFRNSLSRHQNPLQPCSHRVYSSSMLPVNSGKYFL